MTSNEVGRVLESFAAVGLLARAVDEHGHAVYRWPTPRLSAAEIEVRLRAADDIGRCQHAVVNQLGSHRLAAGERWRAYLVDRVVDEWASSFASAGLTGIDDSGSMEDCHVEIAYR